MLNTFLDHLVRQGSLTIIFPNGSRRSYGRGEPHVAVRLHDRRATIELIMRPEMKLGELYMDRRLTVEADGQIADFLDLLMTNLNQRRRSSFVLRLSAAVGFLMRGWRQFNPASRAKTHVAHHYDLSGRLYDLFLGKDKQYSCGYFNNPNDTLEEAQIAKKRHIAAKLFLKRGNLSVLDIGCGWGGLALDLVRDAEAKVTGVTLSEEQIAIAMDRAAKAGLSKGCEFYLLDYRAIKGEFDRIVSVGMFEHVGVPHYLSFFTKINELLKKDGVALLHFIGRLDGPGRTNPWIEKYIFPGGYAPALSEVVPMIAKAGLLVADIEVLRIHYAETLKAWRERFATNRDKIADLCDERFCRMWEFYLAASEASFRHDGMVVYQIQITKQLETLPITRDYILETERLMKLSDVESRPHQTAA
jgi:cyclopropane-fatty-acyl-phospholipid synthase